MKSSSYYKTKDYIFLQLQKMNRILEPNDIADEIINFKTLTSELGLKNIARLILRTGDLSELIESEWIEIQRELETQFDVRIENGILIQGEEQQNRDNVWWSDSQKQKVDNYYWDRYKLHISKSFPVSVIKTINEDTDILMNNLGDPSLETFSRYGMTVGHVQSGKTANYAALICKAADAGYKFIVVIAGGINNLRNQTQVRINEAFVGEDRGRQIGAGIGNSEKGRLPISLTTSESDFNQQDADRNSQGINFDNTRVPILLVIKKNTKTLSNVIKWIQNISKNKISSHAMLLIDDESDYASINTNEEEDPTAINKKLRKLLSLFNKNNYIAYTATPYANIFIDHEATNEGVGQDLFPKDFIYALDAPSNYLGARKIFLDSDNRHLVEIDDYKDYLDEKHKKDLDLKEIPESMYDAVRLFIINVSIRFIRNDGDKHNSMLIHATRFTNVHEKISLIITDYIKQASKEIGLYGMLSNAIALSPIISSLKKTFRCHYGDILKLSWEEILAGICKIIDSVLVREVHQRTRLSLVYSKDRPTNVIAVGGTSLSRGYTLEGLSISYFLRNTVFYDTLMQMGRWFGYRQGYEELCRVYMPKTRISHFSHIIEATEDLIEDFKIMAESKRTPNEFGLAIRQHPDSVLQITARNKQKHVTEFYLDMNLDGKAKETSWLLCGENDRKHNLETIVNLIKEVHKNNSLTMVGKTRVWKNINRALIIKFLNEFKIYEKEVSLGILVRMPLEFILKYAKERECNWDIALYSGEGEEAYTITGSDIQIHKEIRQVEQREGYWELNRRQVSSGQSETVTLEAEERKAVGDKRKEARKLMKRPLLMLHILETDMDKNLAAFGVSFPGDVLSNSGTVRVMMNTVGVKNLLEEENINEE